MAAVGRGRGRGRGLLARDFSADDSVKQVGGGEPNGRIIENGTQDKKRSESKDSINEIQGCLDRLSLDVSDEDISNITELAESASVTDEGMKSLTEIVYKKCVSDREFAKTGAYLCDKLMGIEVNGTKFRSCLLGRIQTDFKDKEKHRENISVFLNNFSFMCQVFGQMRTAGGEVFKPLVVPLFDYISLIVDAESATNDEFECLNEQVQSIGQDLEQNDRERMEALMEKVRNLIIRKGTSAPIRCALLELFECYCRGWKELQNDVTRFYCDTMMDIITD